VCNFDQLFAFGALRFLITAGPRKRVVFVASISELKRSFVPRSEGVRIIGRSFGRPIDLDCDAMTAGLADFTISIYHLCDRWVDISGMPIVDKPFRNIENLIDKLLTEIKECIYLE
jgi:hypothetical protein